jgi:DNA-binding Xre family transcriptional regulator
MMSYKKLWKVLIDKDLKKKDLVSKAHISTYTISKLNRGDNVTTEVLEKICKALDCNIGDIVDVVPDPADANKK